MESFSASNIAKILAILSVFESDIGTWRFHGYIKNKKTFNVSQKKFPSEDFFPIFLAQIPLIYTFLLIFKL